MIRLYTFLIFVAMAIVALYAVFVMPQPDFESQIDLLIAPQNSMSATNIDNSINDMIFIAESEMQNNPILQQYDANVEINRMTEHNIMSISIYDNSQKDITVLSSEVVIDIVNSIKKYYAINQDFEIKVAHIQDAQKTNLAIWGPYVMMSLGAIILIIGVLLIFNIIDIVRERNDYDENIDGEKIFAQYKTQNQIMTNESDDEADNEIVNENIQEKEYEVTDDIKDEQDMEEVSESKEEDIEEVGEELDFEKNKSTVKKSVSTNETKQDSTVNVTIPEGLPTTPGNLPVADISEFGGTSQETTDTGVETESIRCDDVEPTEEELKARLNELLNGKL